MRRTILIDHIKTFIRELSDYISRIEKTDMIPGKLRIKKENGIIRFYIRDNPQANQEKYLSKTEISTIRRLAQQDFDRKSQDKSNSAIEALEQCLQILGKHQDPFDLYETLSPERKELIIPPEFREDIIEEFKNRYYYKKAWFRPGEKVIRARNGLRVRSKSEASIIDIFEALGIPYLYEYPFESEEETIFPDFRVLNVRTGKEYIYEHYGMMDNPLYVEKNLMNRIFQFANAGVFLGDQLLITFETNNQPLNEVYLENFIRHFFL